MLDEVDDGPSLMDDASVAQGGMLHSECMRDTWLLLVFVLLLAGVVSIAVVAGPPLARPLERRVERKARDRDEERLREDIVHSERMMTG